MAIGERRLAAIMFTDMVGYTALGQRNESLSLALVEEQRKTVRPVLEQHNGKEVKTIGDAFLVEFPSALEAVSCALAIQERIREHNLGVSQDLRVTIRIGVHVGDVTHLQGDIMGDAVNVASRIEPLSEPGGVCITEQVYDHVRNKMELAFERLEGKNLKNVRVPIDVYKMVMPWESKPTLDGELDSKRVAVLPFTNMSPDPADQYFADGMTEELITALSKVKGLAVISRTSVMLYKNQSKRLTDIARELGVGTLVEGSVRKAGSRIRIAVQLIDARTDDHLWAENYERNIDDIFAIQSDVAMRVSDSLEAGVFAPQDLKLDSANIEAYTTYLRATQLSHQNDEPSLKEAITLFERSISIDPDFVRPYVGEALAWTGMALGGYADMTMVKERAEDLATKALRLSPNSAETHAAYSVVLGYLDRFGESADEAEKALEINPNESGAEFSLGMNQGTIGDLDSALSHFRKAHALDPLSFHTPEIISLVLRTMGKVEEAEEVLVRLRKLYPNNPRLYLGFAECRMLKEDFDAAQKSLDEGLSISPGDPLLRIDRGLIHALTGRKEDALEVLRSLQEDKSQSVRLYSKLFILAALGDMDGAMDSLMKAPETHVWPFLIKTLPIFEELRKDQRFEEFCTMMGI